MEKTWFSGTQESMFNSSLRLCQGSLAFISTITVKCPKVCNERDPDTQCLPSLPSPNTHDHLLSHVRFGFLRRHTSSSQGCHLIILQMLCLSHHHIATVTSISRTSHSASSHLLSLNFEVRIRVWQKHNMERKYETRSGTNL